MNTISEILSTLKVIGIGCHCLRIGIVYRDAVLKCKMLLNSEVWHSLTAQQVSVLESVDKTYLRSILRCHDKVAIECIFLRLDYYLINMRLLGVD